MIRSVARYAALALICVLPLASCIEAKKPPIAPSSLNPPYDIAPALPAGEVPSRMPCRSAPVAPVKDLLISGVYRRDDPHRAEIDEESREEYIGQTRALYRFENKLLEMSNLYLRSGHESQAACVLDWLYEWASAEALLGRYNVQGSYVRQWSLASLSSAYLQIQAFVAQEPVKDRIVRAWLKELAEAVMGDYRDIDDPRRMNNHLYWAAWAVTNTGIALNDRALYDWGVNKAKYALAAQAREDGALPLEMARGKKALHYHVFALAPLAMIAEAAARNGENLYALRDGILHELVQKTFSGILDPAAFEAETGFRQESIESISPGHFSWLVVYNARFQDPAVADWLKGRFPVFSRRTGGDMGFLYNNN